MATPWHQELHFTSDRVQSQSMAVSPLVSPVSVQHDTVWPVPVSPVSLENDSAWPVTASPMSPEHDRPIIRNQSLGPSNPNGKIYQNSEERVGDEDMTSAPSSNEIRTIQDQLPNYPSAPSPTCIGNSDLATFTWLPYTHRTPYILALFAISIALGLTIILLSLASSTKDGLGDDNSTSIVLFGWRFIPTFIVAFFVILETLLLNDVRRTEVFARLSNSSGLNASSTVLLNPGNWWNDPLSALSSNKNGGLRSQILLYASIVNMIGSFLLLPLSAAFLSSEPTLLSRSATFTTISSVSNATAAISPNDEAYFKTISALVLNFTDSVWLTDDYAIIPFWPASLSPPLGATVPVTSQNWTANTTIFQTELNCVPMSMKNLQMDSFQLVSDDGCSLGVSVSIPEARFPPSVLDYTEESELNALNSHQDSEEDKKFFFPVLNSGSWWVSTGISQEDFSSTLSWNEQNNSAAPGDFRNQTTITNVSAACEGRYILAVNKPFNISYTMVNASAPLFLISSDLPTFSIISHLCTTRFFMAGLSATLSISSSNTSVSFDQAAFNQSKVEIQTGDFNANLFESAFYSDTWTKKLNTSSYGTWMGPSAVLGALYSYDVQAMMNDSLMLSKAQKVEQQFFGEALIAALPRFTAQGSASRGGTIVLIEERIIASFGIGITMGFLFFVSSILLILVYYHSRLSRRPLNLERDPGSATAVSHLLKHTATTSYFHGLDCLPEPLIRRRLGDLSFVLEPQGLVANHAESLSSARESPKVTYSGDWRPFVLRASGSLSLIVSVALLTSGLSVLFAVSESRRLYQVGLLNHFTISLKNNYINPLAPYSIILTLIAVCTRLWWVAAEKTFERLQPYVSMTKRPVTISAGPALLYQNAAPVWSLIKAVHMKNWLLALICLGTILTEVFTVSMSALLRRNTSSIESQIILSRNVRLREVPEIFLVDMTTEGQQRTSQGDPTTSSILEQLYGESQVLLGWMYGAVIELSYAGSSLPWTREDWSFVPASLNSSENGSFEIGDASELGNLTLEASSLRGRLECTAVDMSNKSHWLRSWDLTNSTLWNLSAITSQEKQYGIGYELGNEQWTPGFYIGPGPEQFNASGIWSTIFANPSLVRCCANETDAGPGLSVLGYWSLVGHPNPSPEHGGDTAVYGSQPTTTNFTVKWIIGKPFANRWPDLISGQTYDDGFFNHYMWSEIPQVVVLNCAPIIESSIASATVTRESGQVVEFTILQATGLHKPAWSDYYLPHKATGGSSDPTDNYNKSNVTVSYGYLFMNALLGAADSGRVGITGVKGGYLDEPINDRQFSFRQTGFNSDLMSYATWSILGGNHSALLDPSLLAETSSRVFSNFFQHFVSENKKHGGGRAYMPLKHTVPDSLLPILNSPDDVSSNVAVYQDTNNSTDASPTISALLSRPIYILVVSRAAVIICVSILIFLGFTALLSAFAYRPYFKALPRDMDTLASVIALVYDSPKLLKWLAEQRDGREREYASEPKAVLGYFKGSEGDMRWGIELVEDEAHEEKDDSSGDSIDFDSLNVASSSISYR